MAIIIRGSKLGVQVGRTCRLIEGISPSRKMYISIEDTVKNGNIVPRPIQVLSSSLTSLIPAFLPLALPFLSITLPFLPILFSLLAVLLSFLSVLLPFLSVLLSLLLVYTRLGRSVSRVTDSLPREIVAIVGICCEISRSR
ncbi:hypothetical protein C8R42DRAFT_681213 [Lentinula raphanica]|nr:hypothetical protein C8R42DRAFT_681213 [Lentinula raphanica]